MKWHRCVGAMAALVLAFGTAAQAELITHGGTTINMDFVTIGNAGNAADNTGFGAMGYNYRIGKYEVTAEQWAEVIAADPNVGDAGNWSGSQPTGGTSWYEAAKFCNWLTTGSAATGVYSFNGPITAPTGVTINRTYRNAGGVAYVLPSEDEWYKAAYYDPNKLGAGVGGYWDYPTKHDYPAVPDGIDFAGDTAFDAVFYQGYDQGAPNSVDNAGVLSAYGTMGQGGNVWEWNETAGSPRPGQRGGLWGEPSSTCWRPPAKTTSRGTGTTPTVFAWLVFLSPVAWR